MEVSGQFYAPAASHAGEEPAVPTAEEAWWASELVWTRCQREYSQPPSEIEHRSSDRPARSLVATPTKLPRLYQGYRSLLIHSTRPINRAYYVEI